jgi:hypothetical protein
MEKDQVYSTKPSVINGLKERITTIIQQILEWVCIWPECHIPEMSDVCIKICGDKMEIY